MLAGLEGAVEGADTTGEYEGANVARINVGIEVGKTVGAVGEYVKPPTVGVRVGTRVKMQGGGP